MTYELLFECKGSFVMYQSSFQDKIAPSAQKVICLEVHIL